MEALSWMIVLFVALFCFYKRLAGIWSSAIISAALVFAGSCSQLSLTTVYVMAVTWVMVVTLFTWPLLRQTILTKHLLRWFKQQQPEISPVEQAVLDAGGYWYERSLLSGELCWDSLFDLPITHLTEKEQHFIDNQVETLCGLLDDWKICHEEKNLSEQAWNYIKQERFWGIEIDPQYGGLGFSPAAHSAIVTKVATRSVSAAYTVMVPNSLGPAELIHHFGTLEQKERYLPRLASGQEVPCFALTGPDAGSDAANLPDTGVVCYDHYQGERVLGLRLNWEKRYITLAPIATLIGLAVRVSDPEQLLGTTIDLGIQVVLVPHDTPGVTRGARHAPMSLGFMNGPLSGQDVFLPLSQVLGSLSSANQGWTMLLECLSIGRGISMPALSSAVAQQCFKLTSAYSRIREQFHRPIGHFEGIKSALAEIGGYSYIIEATRHLTTEAVVQGAKPAVASVMSKYHLTELSRRVLLRSMDIHAGHGLQMGPSNLLANVFNGQPISTVGEGANIMTRNLIIFGQGLLRSHPFLKPAIQAAHQSNSLKALEDFDRLFWKHTRFIISQTLQGVWSGVTCGRFIPSPKRRRSITRYCRGVTQLSTALILLSELTLSTLGKNLKMKESISAKLGDAFSYLYLTLCVLKFYEDHNHSGETIAMRWACDFSLSEAYHALDQLTLNFPKRRLARLVLRALFPWGKPFHQPTDLLSHELADWMQMDTSDRERLTALCYVGRLPNEPINRVERAFKSILQNQALFDKVELAIWSRKIGRAQTREETLRQAQQQAVITQAEYETLMTCEHLREQACTVDVFEHMGCSSWQTIKQAHAPRSEKIDERI